LVTLVPEPDRRRPRALHAMPLTAAATVAVLAALVIAQLI
jgi:hypothetical protein